MNSIIFMLTTGAQKAAARAGQPAAREQTIELPTELVPRALDMGATIDSDGCVILDAAKTARAAWGETPGGWDCPTELDQRPESPAAALYDIAGLLALAKSQAAAAQKEQIAEVETKAAEALAAELTAGSGDPWPYNGHKLLSEPTKALLCERVARQKEMRAEREAGYSQTVTAYEAGGDHPGPMPGASDDLRRRTSTEHDQRKEMMVERRLDQLAALVGGLPNAKERIAAGPGPLGLLPEKEALLLLRDATLPVGGELAAYRDLLAWEVRGACECSYDEYDGEYGGEVSYLAESPEAAGGLTIKEWEAVKEIRKKLVGHGLPEGKIQLHRGRCDDERCPSWPVRRVGVLVELDLGGGVVVKREYGSNE